MTVGDEGWKRKLACQICAQLPDDTAEALAVLGLARVLVERFLVPQELPQDQPASCVLAFDSSSLRAS